MAGEKFATMISALIIAIVGINILLVFGSFYGYNIKDFAGITGGATNICKNVVGGVECRGVFYEMRPFKESCPAGTTKACTNGCEIERAMALDDRVCPTHCTDYCLSADVANLLAE